MDSGRGEAPFALCLELPLYFSCFGVDRVEGTIQAGEVDRSAGYGRRGVHVSLGRELPAEGTVRMC